MSSFQWEIFCNLKLQQKKIWFWEQPSEFSLTDQNSENQNQFHYIFVRKSLKCVSVCIHECMYVSVCMNWSCLPFYSTNKKNKAFLYCCDGNATGLQLKLRVPPWQSPKEKSLLLLQDTYKPRCQLQEREMSQGDEVTLEKQSLAEKQESQPATRAFFRVM